MQQHIQETIDDCLAKIKYTGQSSDLHHGDVMHLIGYASALMHAGVINVAQWGEIRRMREEADAYYMENY